MGNNIRSTHSQREKTKDAVLAAEARFKLRVKALSPAVSAFSITPEYAGIVFMKECRRLAKSLKDTILNLPQESSARAPGELITDRVAARVEVIARPYLSSLNITPAELHEELWAFLPVSEYWYQDRTLDDLLSLAGEAAPGVVDSESRGGKPSRRSERRTERAQHPRRARWLLDRLTERGWSRHDLERNNGPNWKTVQKILDGVPVGASVLDKVARALSTKRGIAPVTLTQIPLD